MKEEMMKELLQKLDMNDLLQNLDMINEALERIEDKIEENTKAVKKVSEKL